MSKRYVIVACLTLALIASSGFLLSTNPASLALRFSAKLVIILIGIVPLVYWSLTLCEPQRRKILIGSLLLLGVSTAISLIAAEAVARHVFSSVTTTAISDGYFMRRWQQEFPPVVNRWGFRERDFSAQPQENTFRIAVIGDSFTYGQGISDEQRMTNVLERRLNRLSGDKYEVLNFGRPGTGTTHHLRTLKQLVLEVSPDYVLLQWLVNDVEGSDISERPKPWRIVPSDFLGGLLHRNSALYYLVNNEWRLFQQKLGLVEGYDEYMVRRFRDPNAQASHVAREALVGFFLAAREKTVPVGVILFPQLGETGGVVKNYPLGFLIDRVVETCKQYRILCLDLRPTFATVQPATRLWVNRLDGHPGPLANKLAADAVFQTFGDEWLKPRR